MLTSGVCSLGLLRLVNAFFKSSRHNNGVSRNFGNRHCYLSGSLKKTVGAKEGNPDFHCNWHVFLHFHCVLITHCVIVKQKDPTVEFCRKLGLENMKLELFDEDNFETSANRIALSLLRSVGFWASHIPGGRRIFYLDNKTWWRGWRTPAGLFCHERWLPPGTRYTKAISALMNLVSFPVAVHTGPTACQAASKGLPNCDEESVV